MITIFDTEAAWTLFQHLHVIIQCDKILDWTRPYTGSRTNYTTIFQHLAAHISILCSFCSSAIFWPYSWEQRAAPIDTANNNRKNVIMDFYWGLSHPKSPGGIQYELIVDDANQWLIDSVIYKNR